MARRMLAYDVDEIYAAEKTIAGRRSQSRWVKQAMCPNIDMIMRDDVCLPLHI